MSSNHNEPSKLSALKDQAVGTVKHAIGNVLGNNKLEVEGKAQKVHGKNEYEHAKAAKNKESEPEVPTHQGYDPQTYNQQSFPQPNSQNPSAVQGPLSSEQNSNQPPVPSHPSETSNVAYDPQTYNEQIYPSESHNQPNQTTSQVPVPPQDHSVHPPLPPPCQPAPPPPPQPNFNKHTEGSNLNPGNAGEELKAKAKEIHGKNETEFLVAEQLGLDEPAHYAQGTKTTRHAEGEVEDQSVSSFGALKDKTMGSVKEMFGTMTGNQDMELKGKAQKMHGRNEAEFVKAEKEGLTEPEHFGHGKKLNAQGEVEGDKVSAVSAIKDKVIGSAKESYGSATGNMNTELEGKAQQIHGKNEAEFAKAQKQGLTEPEHFAQGTKTTDHAEGTVVGQEPSKISGWKDQAVGSVKESFAHMTNNPKMELEGKAQKMQGSHECAQTDIEKNTLNA